MNRLLSIISLLLLVASACSKTDDNSNVAATTVTGTNNSNVAATTVTGTNNSNVAATTVTGTANSETPKNVVAPDEPKAPAPTQSAAIANIKTSKIAAKKTPATAREVPHVQMIGGVGESPAYLDKSNDMDLSAVKSPPTQKHAQSKPIQKALSKTASAKPVWLTSETLARARAKKLKRKILIDFGASWCLPCEQYEKITFADKNVSAKLASMVLLKFDVSANSDADKALQQRFGVKTLPALLILSPSGKEQKRITKFLQPTAFLATLGN